MNVAWLTPAEHTTPWDMRTTRAPQKRGIGFAYHAGLTDVLLDEPGLVDFLALSPDTLCRECSFPGEHRLAFAPALLTDALRAARGRPLSIHGLPPATSSLPDAHESYLDCLDALCARRHVLWHSAHLTFLSTEPLTQRRPPQGRIHTSRTVSTTDGTLDLLIPRIRLLNDRFGVPLLLDHLTTQLPGILHGESVESRDFLHELLRQTDCFLLLDLTQIDEEARAFDLDPYEAVARLPLERVAEVYLAGHGHLHGSADGGEGPMIAPRVWALLDWLAQRTPNLAGLVYEAKEEGTGMLSVSALCGQLVRARLAWDLHCAAFAAVLPRPQTLGYAELDAHP